MWNGKSLRGLTFEEVYDVIFESKMDTDVELIVHRLIGPRSLNKAKNIEDLEVDRYVAPLAIQPSVTVTSPGSPEPSLKHTQQNYGATHSQNCGRIQLKMFYVPTLNQLTITIINAVSLLPRENGQPRNPYCKLYVLPDRSEKSKRRTKTVAGTLDPFWNQSFLYNSVKKADLKNQSLQIVVYDYDRIGSGEYVAETVVDLHTCDLSDEAQWFTLYRHDDGSTNIQSMFWQQARSKTSTTGTMNNKDHLSPQTTVNLRLSDSDVSEMDENNDERRRRGNLFLNGNSAKNSRAKSCSPSSSLNLIKKRQLPQIPIYCSQSSID
ncbi:hypothetical protein HELRODRAFT_97443, partial [Helobdella robusta]|uniref:C2 domain-containing protein n=1 Tax=Helobdella robusta TaxID=6412 RepID=T1G9G7_HELRO